jgi:hypothetical protein
MQRREEKAQSSFPEEVIRGCRHHRQIAESWQVGRALLLSDAAIGAILDRLSAMPKAGGGAEK